MTTHPGLSILTGIHYHWVERISAHTNVAGALTLILHGNSGASEIQLNQAEITIFTDDVELTDRLVKAINGAANASAAVEVAA